MPVRLRDKSLQRKTCAPHEIKQTRERRFGDDTGTRVWNSAKRGGGAVAGAHSRNHGAGSSGPAKYSLSGPLVWLLINLGKRPGTSGLQGKCPQHCVKSSRGQSYSPGDTEPMCGADSVISPLLLRCPLSTIPATLSWACFG